jgi:lysophospholipase L1-like esterase
MRSALVFGFAATFIGTIVGGGMMEGALRAYAALDRTFGRDFRQFDPMAVQIEPNAAFGYRQRPNATFHYANGTVAHSNAMGFRGPEVAQTPAPGTVRIILLGGSTTHGFGVNDDQTIDAYMRTIYQQKHPEGRVEVVNLAFDGYDSYQMLQRLESDGLRLHPTVVVLNEGINDVRNAQFPNLADPDPRTLIWEPELARLRLEATRGPKLWTRLKHYCYIARIPGYLRDKLAERRVDRSRQRQAAHAASQVQAVESDALPRNPPYGDAAKIFSRHMAQMISLSLARSAAVLLSTPPSDLRDVAPTAISSRTYWVINARVTQAYRDTLAARLLALESSERAQGHAVRYIAPVVPRDDYLDDCHLTAEGNRVVAAALVDQIDTLLARQKPISRRRVTADSAAMTPGHG